MTTIFSNIVWFYMQMEVQNVFLSKLKEWNIPRFGGGYHSKDLIVYTILHFNGRIENSILHFQKIFNNQLSQ